MIDRSETRDIPRNPVATLEAAVMFGARVANPILATVLCAVRPLDRTYDRKRSDLILGRLLQAGGRPHMDSGLAGYAPRPGMTASSYAPRSQFSPLCDSPALRGTHRVLQARRLAGGTKMPSSRNLSIGCARDRSA